MKKKWLRYVLVFLLLGVGLNVGVAWFVSYRSEPDNFDPHFTARLRFERWEREAATPELALEKIWIESAWRGPGLVFVTVRHADPAKRVQSYRAGWPMAGLGAEATLVGAEPASNPPTSSYRWGVRLSASMILPAEFLPGQTAFGNKRRVRRVLPFRPLWPGFLVNSSLGAVVSFVAWLVPWQVRRVVRRWRGRCPACGYDLRRRLMSGCSECGWRRNRHDASSAPSGPVREPEDRRP